MIALLVLLSIISLASSTATMNIYCNGELKTFTIDDKDIETDKKSYLQTIKVNKIIEKLCEQIGEKAEHYKLVNLSTGVLFASDDNLPVVLKWEPEATEQIKRFQINDPCCFTLVKRPSCTSLRSCLKGSRILTPNIARNVTVQSSYLKYTVVRHGNHGTKAYVVYFKFEDEVVKRHPKATKAAIVIPAAHILENVLEEGETLSSCQLVYPSQKTETTFLAWTTNPANTNFIVHERIFVTCDDDEKKDKEGQGK